MDGITLCNKHDHAVGRGSVVGSCEVSEDESNIPRLPDSISNLNDDYKPPEESAWEAMRVKKRFNFIVLTEESQLYDSDSRIFCKYHDLHMHIMNITCTCD